MSNNLVFEKVKSILAEALQRDEFKKLVWNASVAMPKERFEGEPEDRDVPHYIRQKILFQLYLHFADCVWPVKEMSTEGGWLKYESDCVIMTQDQVSDLIQKCVSAVVEALADAPNPERSVATEDK